MSNETLGIKIAKFNATVNKVISETDLPMYLVSLLLGDIQNGVDKAGSTEIQKEIEEYQKNQQDQTSNTTD